jgi:2'-5' RNA ligase
MNRYFFALNPDEQTREKIVLTRSQLSCSGRQVKNENIHLTLLFLGVLTQEQQQKVVYEAKKITFSECELSLNKTGYFKKSQIVWLGFNVLPQSLLTLNQLILDAARQSKIEISQQTYRPHVTLARKSEKIHKIVVEPVEWKITGFVLLKSIDTRYGVKYQMVEHFNASNRT